MRKFTLAEYLRVTLSAALLAPGFLRRPCANREEIDRYRLKHLKRMVQHAWENCTFYRDKYKKAGISPDDLQCLDDLQAFPAVTKDEIIEAIQAGRMGNGSGTIESISSGSSGRVITVPHNAHETAPYAAGRYRILSMNGHINPFWKTMYVYTSEFPASSLFGLYSSTFVSTLNPVDDTVKNLERTRPQILCIYPSHLFEIARALTPGRARKLGLKLISVNSEMSSRAQRDELAAFFGCPVLDEYSTEELGWTASECMHGQYHVWEDLVHLEILETGSEAGTERGEIIGTNLVNFRTPFIRYRQGDLGRLQSGDGCPCGRKFRVLTELLGRKNDSFVFGDKILSSAYLLDAVYGLLLDEKLPISDFCLLQHSEIDVECQITPQRSEPDLAQKAAQFLQKKFPPGVKVRVQITDRLHKTVSGKRNPILRLAPAEEAG